MNLHFSFISFLFLCLQMNAHSANCSESRTLLLYGKMKDLGVHRTAELHRESSGVQARIDCSALNQDDIRELHSLRKEGQSFCEKFASGDGPGNTEGCSAHSGLPSISESHCSFLESVGAEDSSQEKSLNSLAKAMVSESDKCSDDFAASEFTSLVRSTNKEDSILSLCQKLSSSFDKIQAKRRDCNKKKTAQTKTPSCEIADANGLCPGDPRANKRVAPQKDSSGDCETIINGRCVKNKRKINFSAAPAAVKSR